MQDPVEAEVVGVDCVPQKLESIEDSRYLKYKSSSTTPLWPEWPTVLNTCCNPTNGQTTIVWLIAVNEIPWSSRILTQNEAS